MSDAIKIKALHANNRQSIPYKKEEHSTAAGSSFLKKIEALLSKDISLSGKPLPDKTKESFYLELGSLLDAGLDIRNALQLIRDEQAKKTPKTILGKVFDKVVSGKSLSIALKEDPCFTTYEYFTIEIGEETGKLVPVLRQLSLYYKSKIKQRRQIIGTLTYPLIVLSVAFISVTFMMNYVVPMFADVFKRFGSDLPYLTQAVLGISKIVRIWAGKIVLASGIIAIIMILNRKKYWYKKYKDLLLHKTPLIRTVVSKIYLARFASTMQLLLGAKVPLVQGLALCKQVVEYYPLELALVNMENDILKGIPLHQSMARQKIFPPKMVALVKVGEEVNQLELFFKTLSDRYSEELDYQTAQLSKFIEPVIIVILGLVVGIVLIAMYLPMFNMGNTIG